MSWLTSPTFIVPASVTALFLIGLLWQHVLPRLLATLMLVLSVTALACLGDAPTVTGSSEEQQAVSKNGGVPDPLDPGCADPKTCGEPRPQTLDGGVPSPLDPSCADPKTCGEPRPQGLDAGVPSPLDPGCADPKTCGEPRPQGLDAGVPSPLDPGCADPKTCGEPRPPGH
jgi:hypothetical protein